MAHDMLYLCTGLQSSGTTFVSWCFLQRRDLDGVLDSPYHVLPELPALDRRRLRWFKKNIAVFRTTELAGYFQDFGWKVQPILVIRDVRSVWNSLCTKHYGLNGTTAEDPPLRVRFRRFLDDWRHFKEHNLPILRFESLTEDPVSTLVKTCRDLGLEWDEGMVAWPKRPREIMDAFYGNATFHRNRSSNLHTSLRRSSLAVETDKVPPGDLDWLQENFTEFYQEHDYPLEPLLRSEAPVPGWGVDVWLRPSFKNARQYRRFWPLQPIRRWIVTRPLLRDVAIRLQSKPRFPRKGAKQLD